MLVLSRKVGERVVIAGDIEIGIVSIHGNKVVLGVSAPMHVPVHRLEVQERNREEAHLDRYSHRFELLRDERK